MQPHDEIDWKIVEEISSFDDEPALRGDQPTLPIPNADLRAASSISELGSWFAIGEAWALIASRLLPPNPTVLDLGCGCGKIARFLYFQPSLRYVGVDIFLPAVAWCQRAFGDLAGDRFRFVHFDGISQVYNPQGTIRPCEFRLPMPDQSVDLTICASLFTHLLELDCVHYLAEIHRVSKEGGQALISIHNEPALGERFVGDEARIDVDEEYFLDLAKQAGLELDLVVGNVYGQQTLVFRRPGVLA